MKPIKRKYLKYLLLGVICFLVLWLWPQKKEKENGHPRDYAEIIASGILHAATEYNSISFYVDGDTVTGFHYELIEAFARDKGIQAQVSPVMSFGQRLQGLETGKYDVIAYGILVTSELKDSLLLTSPIILSKQVLVQRKPVSEHDSLFVKNQLDLAGRTLHVVKGSPSILRIRNLGNEIGDTIMPCATKALPGQRQIRCHNLTSVRISALHNFIHGVSASNHLYYWTASTPGLQNSVKEKNTKKSTENTMARSRK